MSYKFYNQNNYSKVPYPCPSKKSATVATSGCGVASMAMIISNMTPTIVDPAFMAAYSLKLGARIDGGGTDMNKLATAICKEYPLKFTTTSDESILLAHLRAGYMAIANVGGDHKPYIGLFSDGGHFIVAAGQDDLGKVIVLDPGYYSGKFNSPARKGKVQVIGNECHCDILALAADTAIKTPAYWLFSKADINADYNAAVDVLVYDKVITSSDYWKSAVAHNTNVQGDWMATVLQKMTSTNNVQSAVNYLVSKGVINSPDYWLANCVAGKTVAAAYAKTVIVNGVAKLKL